MQYTIPVNYVFQYENILQLYETLLTYFDAHFVYVCLFMCVLWI